MTDYLLCRCDYLDEDGTPCDPWEAETTLEDPNCGAHEGDG